MLKGNGFTRDDDDVRRERLVLLSANIGGFAVEFGLSLDKITASEAAQTVWDDAVSAATRESGETHEATEELQNAFKTAKDYYAAAKKHLLAVIYEMSKPDRIIDAYGFDEDIPRNYDGLCHAFNAWIDEHAVLVAEGDPRIVNGTVIAKLTTHRDTLDALKRARALEKDEEVDAYAAKVAAFDAHSKLLDFVYTLACLTWDDDDSNLRLLGFVPSSEVWTPGNGGTSPDIGVPENLAAVIEGENVRISWDAVDGADSYQLVHTEFPPLFLEIYAGADTEFVHVNPPGGMHHYTVRAKIGDSYGVYPEWVSVEVVGVAPGPPKNLVLSYDGTYVHASWEEPDTGTPEYFRLYAKTVPTGTPAPVRPSDPEVDEIITLSVGIFAPPPGNTVYIWVTAFHDGVEGEAAGPESIDIM